MIAAYVTHLLILFAVFAVAALALNLTLGWAGIVNLGHVGLMALGAYASAILTTQYGASMFVGVVVGMALAMVSAVILGLLTRSVTGDALAVILFGFNFAIYTLSLNVTSLTRGALGIPGIPRPEAFRDDRSYLILVLLALLAAILLVRRIVRSPYGRVLGAIRDDELHASVLGKRIFRTKLAVFAVSGALAGLAGALLAHAIRFIDPGSFFLHQLVLVLSIVFVGGLASVRGTIAAAGIMTFLPEVVDALVTVPSAAQGAVRGIVFSGLLLLVVLFRPKGLFGTVELPSSYVDRE